MAETKQFSVNIRLLENYIFQVDFGEFGNVLTDEPEPLGNGEGPNPARMLAAAVVNCLAASLLFAIRKYKGDPGGVHAVIHGDIDRVQKRWRIINLKAELHLEGDTDKIPELDKVLASFEGFCIVTQSVEAGIPVDVTVFDNQGRQLK